MQEIVAALTEPRSVQLTHFLYGGYPEPTVQADSEFFAHWMSNYRQTYIDRDIGRLFPRLNPDNYRRFIGMLGELSGTILNRPEIGRSLNVSESTVRDDLEIAAGTSSGATYQVWSEPSASRS